MIKTITSIKSYVEGYFHSNPQKGITLISLIMTVIILLILSTITISSIRSSNNVAPYNNMIADITLLEDKILVYYNKYGEIPKKADVAGKELEGSTYYEIDLSKLENITLNYGIKTDGDETDIYLVNENLEVYYLKGIEKSGTIHHTNSDWNINERVIFF